MKVSKESTYATQEGKIRKKEKKNPQIKNLLTHQMLIFMCKADQLFCHLLNVQLGLKAKIFARVCVLSFLFLIK